MQRIVYFDFLRGIAIIMVVCLHCIDYSAMEGPVLNLFVVEFRNLLNAAVPLFLAISGYFMANKKTDTPTAYKEFLKRQAVKVYIPMLVWSVPYLILAYLHRENSVTSWLLFFFGGFSIYYFIILIVQYYALLPLMQKMGRSLRGGVLAAVAISIACISCLEILLYVYRMEIPLIVYAGPFPLWIMFFVIGIYLRNHTVQMKYVYPLVLLFFLLSVAESFVIMHCTGQVTGLGIKVFSFLFSLYFIIMLFASPLQRYLTARKDRFIVRSIAKVGEISFGIYLIHMLVNMVLNKLCGYHDFNFILVLTISIVVIVATMKLVPTSIRKYIGFS